MCWRITLLWAVCLSLNQAVSLRGVHKVEMSTYSVLLPADWYVQKENQNSSVYTCNDRNGNCTPSKGGIPKNGMVTLWILPYENPRDQKQIEHLDELMKSILESTRHAQPITEVPLKGSDQSTLPHCQVVRSLTGGTLWADYYGLEIDSKLFRAVAMYNDDPKTNEIFRRTISDILSSIRISRGRNHQ